MWYPSCEWPHEATGWPLLALADLVASPHRRPGCAAGVVPLGGACELL